MFDCQTIIGDRLYPKLWGEYKNPTQYFIDFAIKPSEIWFFFITNLSWISVIYTYIRSILFPDFIISLWFWTKTAETNLENIRIFFQNFQFPESTNIPFPCYELANIEQKFFNKISIEDPSKSASQKYMWEKSGKEINWNVSSFIGC